MAMPIDGADEDPDRAAVGGGRRLADQEERGLDALADDRDERQDGQGRGGPVVDRPIDRRVELAPDAARLAAHPEQHPGHDRGGDDHRQAFEQLLVWLLEAADRLEQDDAEEGAQPEREPGAEEDPREVARVAGLGQIGTDDRDDQRGLDAFAETGQQSAGECADVHHGLPSGMIEVDDGQQGRMTSSFKVTCHGEILSEPGENGQAPRAARVKRLPREGQSPPRISNRASFQLASRKPRRARPRARRR